MSIKGFIILHCETDLWWDLVPWRIRIKAMLGIVSAEEMKEYNMVKIEKKRG